MFSIGLYLALTATLASIATAAPAPSTELVKRTTPEVTVVLYGTTDCSGDATAIDFLESNVCYPVTAGFEGWVAGYISNKAPGQNCLIVAYGTTDCTGNLLSGSVGTSTPDTYGTCQPAYKAPATGHSLLLACS